jgi:hypothetical protein
VTLGYGYDAPMVLGECRLSGSEPSTYAFTNWLLSHTSKPIFFRFQLFKMNKIEAEPLRNGLVLNFTFFPFRESENVSM